MIWKKIIPFILLFDAMWLSFYCFFPSIWISEWKYAKVIITSLFTFSKHSCLLFVFFKILGMKNTSFFGLIFLLSCIKCNVLPHAIIDNKDHQNSDLSNTRKWMVKNLLRNCNTGKTATAEAFGNSARHKRVQHLLRMYSALRHEVRERCHHKRESSIVLPLKCDNSVFCAKPTVREFLN